MLPLQIMRRVSLLAAVACIGAAGLASCSEPAGGGSSEISTRHLKSIPCEESGSGFAFAPLGLDFGLFGELYVIDSDNSRIFVLPDSLDGITLFARCPDEFSDCQLIDIETGNAAGVYVSEKTAGSILVYDRWGEFVSAREVGEGLTGLGLGKPEQIYAAMGIAGTIRIVDLSGDSEPIEAVVSSGDGGTYPVDCLTGKLGNVFVTEAFSEQVLMLSPFGKPRKALVGFDFQSPFGLASYLDRYVLVSDSERAVIAVFSADGGFISSFGEGLLEMPAFIACRDDGVVCVADPGSMSIEVFRIETSTQ
ncbi:MAG: hypothetical protein ABIJ00_06360 [Candidatus Eisenbacteria bacterium]